MQIVAFAVALDGDNDCETGGYESKGLNVTLFCFAFFFCCLVHLCRN